MTAAVAAYSDNVKPKERHVCKAMCNAYEKTSVNSQR